MATGPSILETWTGAFNIPTRGRNNIFGRGITRACELKLSDLGTSDGLGEGTKDFWGQRGVLRHELLARIMTVQVFLLFELASKVFASRLENFLKVQTTQAVPKKSHGNRGKEAPRPGLEPGT